MYDVIILGAGPAGLTAAIYTGRAKLSTLVLEAAMVGGNAGIADIIENYPGFPEGISGSELMARFKQQAENCGAEIRYDEALDIYPSSQGIVVETRLEKLTARAVLVATGARRRQLQVPGEEEFLGRGVSYCATCDGAFFRNSPVAVIGGGDSAVKEALYLADIASRVYLVHRREGFRAHKALVERMHNNERIILKLNQVVDEIEGDEYGVKQLLLKEVKSGQAEKLPVEGVFVSIGMVPAIGFLANRLQTDNGYIVVDESLMTSMPGVFAAGDICSKKVRQVATAVGDGALAGAAITEYLKE
ncbi:MAG: thioredoxin-disulfide reductase [Syntrophomonadaceae bacterium]|nr:thioredoxin-disulfide reductase [Syntrophomonadaceae bacterium]